MSLYDDDDVMMVTVMMPMTSKGLLELEPRKDYELTTTQEAMDAIYVFQVL